MYAFMFQEFNKAVEVCVRNYLQLAEVEQQNTLLYCYEPF